MIKKGIILAGGSGTRLYPLTHVISKQLMPLYDKPMIYYPIGTLMLGGIRDILIITTPEDQPLFKALLKDGHQWGIRISYEEQPEPGGLAQAFIIGRDFVGRGGVCLILGDNVFYGDSLVGLMQRAGKRKKGATVFGYYVRDPENYGVAEFNSKGNVIKVEEKPKNPKSNYAITGLYFYDNQVLDIAASLKPSKRGELEITDLNLSFLNDGELRAVELERNITWLDSGTHESLLDSSNFIAAIEKRQGYKVACLEEVAFNMGFVSGDEIAHTIEAMPRSPYRSYCERAILG